MTMGTEAAAQQAAANEDQSFEEAFAEFAGGQDQRDEVEAETETAAEEPQATEATDPASTNAPASTEEAQPTQQAGESDADFAARLKAAEDAAKEWEHRFKSEVGRQTALQRKVQELQAQLQERPQSQQAQRQYSERMQALMSDFPEIAQALQEELESQLAVVRNEVQQAVAPMKQQEEQRRYEAEETRVKDKYPDFVETVNSPEFLDWFKDQPEAVQALAASPLAKDTLAVLDYFNAARPKPEANPEVENIQNRRQQTLEKHVSVRNSAPAPVADAPDDFETAFDHFARQRERTR